MKYKMLAIGLVLVLSLAVLGCPAPTPCREWRPANLQQDTSMTHVNPANVFYQEIPNWQNPTLAPESPQVMAHFQSVVAASGGRQPFWDAAWSSPVYFVDNSMATVSVRLWESYAVGNWMPGQRVPCWAETDPGNTDASIFVINTDTNCELGLWQYNKDPYNLNTFPCAATGGTWPTDFDGTGRPQAGVTGVFKVQSAGMGAGVWPCELTNINNPINHGFGFAWPWDHTNATPGMHYEPAYKSDGTVGGCAANGQYDMCQGWRIQLNPSYTYGSERKTWERKYMDALKKYGAYDVDSAGYLSWGGLPSKYSCTNNPFLGIFPDEVSLETAGGWDARFPIDQFRLLAHGALISNYAVTQETFCGTYTEYKGTPNPAPAAPTLTSISPSTAAAGSTVTLTGTNMTGTYRVYFGPDTNCAWNPTVVSSTQVRVVVPAGSGTVAVKVKTGGGYSGTQSFTYGGGTPAPTLSSLSPNNGTTAGGTSVTLTGTNLSSTSAVSFGGTAATGIVNMSATQARCTSPAKSAGTYSVTATTPGGTSNGVNYTYNAPAGPTLSSIAPTSGTTAGGTVCTLTGTNLTGTTGVSFGGTAGTSIVNVSSTQVRATSPAKSAATYSVTATTPNGTSNGVNYTYTGGGGPYTATLYSPHDSYVISSDPNAINGQTNLVVQKNAALEFASYLKFDMNSVQGSTITSATLRLNFWTSGLNTFKVYGCTANDSWTETAITWNNKPAWTTQQASFTSPNNNWVNVNVTSYVSGQFNGDKLVTLVVRDDANLNVNIQAYSDETGASAGKRPQLVVISQ